MSDPIYFETPSYEEYGDEWDEWGGADPRTACEAFMDDFGGLAYGMDRIADHTFFDNEDVDVPGDTGCYGGARDFWMPGRLPLGDVYRSKLVNVSVDSLPEGVHGCVNLGSNRPYEALISADQAPDRAAISTLHEIGHIGNKLYRWGFDDNQVHNQAVFVLTEQLPALRALEEKLGLRFA
jgi:hypothetical protein